MDKGRGKIKRLLTSICLCIAVATVAGCGGKISSYVSQNGSLCSDWSISGKMQDSLTGLPVSQGWAVLESGAPIPMTQIYNFTQVQRVKSDSTGVFQMCSSAAVSPAIVVLAALDASGKAYPSFIVPLSNASTVPRTIDLGTLPMGGCTVLCGFDGQEQTSEPATLTGMIVSSPIPKTGSVIPEYTILALDGTKNLWNVLMPVLDDAQTFAFATTALGCTNRTSPCSSYAFTLPSQKPVVPLSGGRQQQASAPVYSIRASADPTCSPSSTIDSYEQDGASPLTADAGAELQVSDISFTNCQ